MSDDTVAEGRNRPPRRVAIVTGGTRGIGRAAVIDLAARGVDVILTYCSDAKAADALVGEASGPGSRVAPCNWTSATWTRSPTSQQRFDQNCPTRMPLRPVHCTARSRVSPVKPALLAE